MKNFIKISILLLITCFFASCEKDSKNGNNESRDFIVAFAEQSISYLDIKSTKNISLIFSDVAVESGSVEIRVKAINAEYGVDFETLPAVSDEVLIIPFVKGDRGAEFTFKNIEFPWRRQDMTIQFQIERINYKGANSFIQGYDVMAISFDAALGGILSPAIGGPSQPFQVYVDLGGKATYPIKRDSWDLAFYSGKEDVVKINGAVYMAAGKLAFNDIDKVNEGHVSEMKKQVQIGTFDAANTAYIDHTSGSLDFTAINKVSDNDVENNVYLLNLGFLPGTGNVAPGSVNITGDERGWMKIRILKRNDGYLLQYANLSDLTHKEVVISKKEAFNFQFFSLKDLKVVNVEPSKKKWDLNFTVFTNTVDQNGTPKGSYGFSDFIVINRYAGVKAYKVDIPKGDKKFYKQFAKQDIVESNLSSDLTTIGGSWRDVANAKVLNRDVFYIIRDSKGNFYKMRMLGFMNEKGERGYPKFEYSLLY